MSDYFEQAGEPSDAPGRFAAIGELAALDLVPGLEFRPIATDSVMVNFVTFEPGAPAPTHHHSEEQIAIVLDGELRFTVGGEHRVMRPGDCVVIPANVPHGGEAGPEGCRALDVFTPPRAAILAAMNA